MEHVHQPGYPGHRGVAARLNGKERGRLVLPAALQADSAKGNVADAGRPGQPRAISELAARCTQTALVTRPAAPLNVLGRVDQFAHRSGSRVKGMSTSLRIRGAGGPCNEIQVVGQVANLT